MRFPAFLAALTILAAAPLAAQDWRCADGACEAAEPAPVAELAGAFRAAAAASARADPDMLAALEQQRWVEQVFEATATARVTVEIETGPGALPADWPPDPEGGRPATVSLLISRDGETFERIESGAVVAEGSYLSLLIAQATRPVGEDAIRYYPARFRVRLFAAAILPEAAAIGAPPLALVPAPELGRFGCTEAGCGEPAMASDLPDLTVEGTASPDPVDPAPDPAPGAPAIRPGGDELAAAQQAELARLGCYSGAIDGLWGPGSRRAMAAFNVATGATLDGDRPTPGALAATARTSDPVCAAE